MSTPTTADFLKRVRTTEKAKFTRQVSKVLRTMEEKGSMQQMKLLRSELDEAFEDCERAHEEYVEGLNLPAGGEDLAKENQWIEDLGVTAARCYAQIKEYVAARSSETSTSSKSNRKKASRSSAKLAAMRIEEKKVEVEKERQLQLLKAQQEEESLEMDLILSLFL